jgi:hypothetical protein
LKRVLPQPRFDWGTLTSFRSCSYLWRFVAFPLAQQRPPAPFFLHIHGIPRTCRYPSSAYSRSQLHPRFECASSIRP